MNGRGLVYEALRHSFASIPVGATPMLTLCRPLC